MLAIAFPGLVEYLTDAPAGELVGPSPRRLSSAREQSKSGHSVTLSAQAWDLVPIVAHPRLAVYPETID